MAIQFSSTLRYDAQTDSGFRALAQFIEDTLVSTGGWSATSDSGQTLPSALLHPTVANTKMGYRIYKMNDFIAQSVFPVFLRIDFGAANIATCPGFWLTIGTGSNGAGTITGILFNGGASASATVNGLTSVSSAPNQATFSYGSADLTRFSICLCSNSVTGAQTIIFTLERTKDALGNDTSDGLLLIWNTGNQSGGAVDSSLYIKSSGAQPAIESGLSYILSGHNPSQMFYPGDIGVGVVLHISGIAQQPGVNMLITNSGDVTIDGIIKLVLYNQIRTYVQCGTKQPKRAITFTGGAYPLDNNARILMRYD